MFFAGGFEIMFSLMFILVFGMILVTIFRGISQWNKNNHSPRLTVDATTSSFQAYAFVTQLRYLLLLVWRFVDGMSYNS